MFSPLGKNESKSFYRLHLLVTTQLKNKYFQTMHWMKSLLYKEKEKKSIKPANNIVYVNLNDWMNRKKKFKKEFELSA